MASRLQDVIIRDTRANQPLATAVAAGTLYFVTDELVLERSNAAAWQSYSTGAVTGITQLTGEVTAGPGTGSQVATIANNAVVTAKILDANVTDAKISNRAAVSVFGRSANSVGVGADIVAATNGFVLRLSGATLGFGQLVIDSIPNSLITYAKIQNISAASRLLGRGSSGGAGDTQEITPQTGIQMSGTNLQTTTQVRKITRGITVDGGGSAITTGVKGYLSIPDAATIVAVRLFADQVGSVVFDIWKDTYANFPPVVADTITAAAKPTIAAAQKYEDTTLTGWTTSVLAGDVLAFNVDSAATITRVTLELDLVKTGA